MCGRPVRVDRPPGSFPADFSVTVCTVPSPYFLASPSIVRPPNFAAMASIVAWLGSILPAPALHSSMLPATMMIIRSGLRYVCATRLMSASVTFSYRAR